MLRPDGYFVFAIVHPINSAGQFERGPDEMERRFVMDPRPYFEERYYADDIERDGLVMRFESVHRPLESYSRALESEGFVVEAIREVGDVEGKWTRMPLFLDVRERACVRRTAMTEEFCYLTTVGRRTGGPHTIEIWFADLGATFYLISGGGDRSDWVRNLQADAAARVRAGDDVYSVRARVPMVDSPERTQAVELLYEKYGDQVSGTLESWHAGAFIVALDRAAPCG